MPQDGEYGQVVVCAECGGPIPCTLHQCPVFMGFTKDWVQSSVVCGKPLPCPDHPSHRDTSGGEGQ